MAVQSAARTRRSRGGGLGLGLLQAETFNFSIFRSLGFSGALNRSVRMAGGSLELLVLFEQLFDLVLKGFSRVLGHLVPEWVKDAIGEMVQAFALLVPVVLEGSRI